MQFKITFKVLKPGQLLPLSYQYELSSWIYQQIEKSDSAFAEFLHSKGYKKKRKRYKFFTFSNLYIPPKYELIDDRIKIWSDEIFFTISFLVDEAANKLITAIFDMKPFRLGDRISQVELAVKSVVMVHVNLKDASSFQLRTTSPLLVSAPTVNKENKLQSQYLSPLDDEFEYYFFQNLKRKYETARAYHLVPNIDIDQPMKFRLLSDGVKKRGIRIRAQTSAETKIIGYLFDFELEAPNELVWVGMMGGFGGENAMGFGASRLLK